MQSIENNDAQNLRWGAESNIQDFTLFGVGGGNDIGKLYRNELDHSESPQAGTTGYRKITS